MTMREFIKENKTELDQCIHNVVPGMSLNNNDRIEFIMNDEGLYNWARSSGVRLLSF